MTMSIEVLTADEESIGYPGINLTKESTPIVVQALLGVTGLVEQSPRAQGTGRMPVAEWSGTGAQMQPVTVFLWSEAPAPPEFPNPEDGE